MPRVLSDFDARYLGALDDFDELEDIEPGSLTLNNKDSWEHSDQSYTANWVGQLTVPSLALTGRPNIRPEQLGKIPTTSEGVGGVPGGLKVPGGLYGMGGRGPGRIVSPGEIRPTQLSGFGVPGKPGTGAVGHAVSSGQPDPDRRHRLDLGTIPGRYHGEVHQSPIMGDESSGMPRSESFVGSIANLFFGRKGGLL